VFTKEVKPENVAPTSPEQIHRPCARGDLLDHDHISTAWLFSTIASSCRSPVIFDSTPWVLKGSVLALSFNLIQACVYKRISASSP